MKRKLVSIVICSFLIVSLAAPSFAAVEVKDMATGHWAYSAVQKLIDRGYLSLYQDRTFRGDNPVDRYTFSVVVARLISEMAAAAPSDSKASQKPEVKEEDQEMLRKLTTEFRDELVQLATEDESIRQNLNAAAKENTVLREDLNKVLVQVYQLQQSTNSLAESADTLNSRLDSVQEETAQNSAAISKLNTRIDSLDTKITDEVLTRASGTYVRQQSMEKDLQKLSQEFESYRRNSESELSDLRAKNQWLSIGIVASVLLSLIK